jgi:tetratricopeptide (TPR) repeat protein
MNETRSDVGKELAELRREVIEGRNLVIKTDNLLKSLHAEIKSVSKRQEEFERRKLVSSGVAYALFAALCVAGALGISAARVSAVGVDKDRYEKTLADLSHKLDEAKKEQSEIKAASARAFEVHRMMTERPGEERLQGVEAFAKMDVKFLSPLERTALKDRAESLRNEIGQGAFERGKTAFRRNDMGSVVKELTRFLAMNPTPQDMLDASFFLGVAHNQLRQHDKAVAMLSNFVAGDRRSKNRDYAMLLLAQSYEQTGQLDKAAAIVRDALGTYPNSEFASQLKGRLSTVKRAMGGSRGEAAPQGSAPQGAAPAVQAPPAAPAR